MRSIRTILALAAICGFAVVPAMADETYYFNVPDGDWSDQGNWTPPGGPPGPGDTAIIQGERHCHVTGYYQECKILKVLAGATLSLEAPCLLKIGDPYEATSSIIVGEVRFMNDTQDAYPMLAILPGGVTLDSGNGGGTLTASEEDECGPGAGQILTCCLSTQVLTVSSDVTVKGDLEIYVHVDNEGGTFAVDHADDKMIFNRFPGRNRPKISGNEYGTFEVSHGKLIFDDCTLKSDNSTTWNLLPGTGTIHVTSRCFCGDVLPYETACAIDITGGERLWVERATGNVPVQRAMFRTTGQFNMSDGILDIDGPFRVRGGAALSGGTIEVAPGKSAEFRHPQ